MKAILKKAIQDKQMPLVMAHSGGVAYGPENSVAGIKATLPYNPDVIDLDIRKSRDGVLYGFHGSGILSGLINFVSHRITFATIQRLLGSRAKLTELLDATPSDIQVFFDIKSKKVTAQDIEIATRNRDHVYWIAVYSYDHLKALHDALGDQYIYVYTWPTVSLEPFLQKAQNIVDVWVLFPFQQTAHNIALIKKYDIAYAYTYWGTDKDLQDSHALRWKGVFVGYDNLQRTHRAVFKD